MGKPDEKGQTCPFAKTTARQVRRSIECVRVPEWRWNGRAQLLHPARCDRQRQRNQEFPRGSSLTQCTAKGTINPA